MGGAEYNAIFLVLIMASAGTAYLAGDMPVFISCLLVVLVLRVAVWVVDAASKAFAGKPLLDLARIGDDG